MNERAKFWTSVILGPIILFAAIAFLRSPFAVIGFKFFLWVLFVSIIFLFARGQFDDWVQKDIRTRRLRLGLLFIVSALLAAVIVLPMWQQSKNGPHGCFVDWDGRSNPEVCN